MDAQSFAIAAASVLTPLVVYLAVWLVAKATSWRLPGDQAAFAFAWLVTFVIATAAYFVSGGQIHSLAEVFDVGAKVFAISQPVFWLLYKPIKAALDLPVATIAKGTMLGLLAVALLLLLL